MQHPEQQDGFNSLFAEGYLVPNMNWIHLW